MNPLPRTSGHVSRGSDSFDVGNHMAFEMMLWEVKAFSIITRNSLTQYMRCGSFEKVLHTSDAF